MDKKSSIYVILAILILVGLGIWLNKVKPGGKNVEKPPQTAPAANTVIATPLTPAKIAASLPANFPSETGAKTVQNLLLQDTAAKENKILYTTTTVKNLADAFTLYKGYLTDKKWVITKTTDLPTLKEIWADFQKQSIDISISYDGGSKSNIVVVTLTTQP